MPTAASAVAPQPPTGSGLSHLECSRCARRLPADAGQHLCPCGGPLLARYDLEAVARRLDRARLAEREASLWRYRELLPVADPAHITTLGEGWTPLLPLRRWGQRRGLRRLWLKDEGLNPSGTFKARGAAVGISRARELGARAVAMPTAGNAGGAWALYAARAGLAFHVAMPQDAPAAALAECLVAGARVYLVDGLISDAGRLVARGVARHGWYDAGTLREPYRIEGKKTMGLELAEQMGWELPDVILYPCGGGVGLIGLWKAFDELEQLGWIGSRRPRLVAVQAEGCSPIVRAFRAGQAEVAFFEGAETVAAGLRVPGPLGGFLVLRALRETAGVAVAVSDQEIRQAMEALAREEGLFVCPEGACALAGLERLLAQGWVGRDERVVVLNTGSGLKYAQLVQGSPLRLPADAELPA